MKRALIVLLLIFPAGPAIAQEATADAIKCRSICDLGRKMKLTSPDDKTQYFTCFLAGHCVASSCSGGEQITPNPSKTICNPVAKIPPSGTPLDIFKRGLSSAEEHV